MEDIPYNNRLLWEFKTNQFILEWKQYLTKEHNSQE